MRFSGKTNRKLAIGMAVLLALVMGLKLVQVFKGDEADEPVQAYEPVIPDAEETEVEGSKLNAYKGAERIWNANERYSDEEDLYAEDNQKTLQSQSRTENEVYNDIVSHKPSQSDGGPSREAPYRKNTVPAPGEDGYREYRMQQYYDNTNNAVARGEARKDSIKALADGNGLNDNEVTKHIGEKASVRKSSAMSSLDDWDASGSSSGFSSLSDEDDTVKTDLSYPFECMFIREEKLRSGSRVSIRLLEDMVVDGVLIPKNTHLMANCEIKDRLELTVSSLERNSRIYALDYEAYDNDGGKGIYCPSLNGKAVQTAKNRGMSTIGSLINSRLGRIASSAVQTGISIGQSKSGEITVSVPSGYRFYIVKNEKN